MDEVNKMKKEEIKEFILRYIEMKGKLPENTDIDSFDYVGTGYLDSLSLIKFVVKLEEKFDIEIEDEEILRPEFRTIGGLVSFIQEKIR